MGRLALAVTSLAAATFGPACAVEIPSERGAATFTGFGGRIVYAGDADGDFEIYLLEDSDEPPVQVTHNLVDDVAPRWSNDGSRILYTHRVPRDWKLISMRADGSYHRRIASNTTIGGSWSPDDSEVVFARSTTRPYFHTTLFVANADGTNEYKLPTAREFVPNDPDWSADDVLLVTARQGISTYEIETGRVELLRESNPTTALRLSQARWSPDGATAVVVGREDESLTASHIFLLSADGTDLSPLTSGDETNRFPSFSPDGEELVFSRGVDESHLFVMKVDGSGLRQVTRGEGQALYPDWHL